MSSTGDIQGPQEQGESVAMADVLQFYKERLSSTQEELALAHGRIGNRDRRITQLEERIARSGGGTDE